MKYQLNALTHSLKNIKNVFIVYMCIIIAEFIAITSRVEKIKRMHMLGVLGVINKNQNNNLLLFLFQVFFIIYFLQIFFTYEKNNSIEFTFCRTSKKKILIWKFIISIVSIIVFRVIYFFVIYNLFKEFIVFTNNDFLLNVFEYIGIGILYIAIYSFVSLKKS